MPTLFKDALKAFRDLGFKNGVQILIEEAMHSLPRLQFDDVSSSGFVYLSTTSVLNLLGETNFIASAAKAEATVRRKAGIGCVASVLLQKKKSAMAR